jgi:hypothetical protein
MNGAFIETQKVTGGTQTFGTAAGTLASQGQGIFASISGTIQLVGFNGSVAGLVCQAHPTGPGGGIRRSVSLVDHASFDLEVEDSDETSSRGR